MKVSKKAIDKFMMRKRLNYKELAAESGIAFKTVYRMINGANCRRTTIYKLADALECEPEELIMAY